MRSKLLAAVPVLLLASTAAMASSYQFEVGAGFTRIDLDVGGDVDTWAIGGEFHFAPVDTRSGPLAEAAFLQRSSNVFAGASRTEIGPFDLDVIGAGIEFYVPDTMFYLAGEVARVRLENGFSTSETGWSVFAGITPSDGMLLRVGYSDELPSFAFGTVSEAWTVDGKFVVPLNGQGAVNLEAGVTVSDDINVYSVGGDYYFDRRFSVGAAYDYLDPDVGGSESAFTIRGQAFFTDTVNATAFATFMDDDAAYGISLSVRF